MPPSGFCFHAPRRSGFTLVELVVVIVVLGILFITFIGLTAGPSQRERAEVLLWQGAQTAKALKIMDIEEDLGGALFPSSTNSMFFATSTDYFKYLIERDVLSGQNFSLFGGAGASLATTLDASRFNATNNAWSVVVDTTTTNSDQTPFLISRNLVLPGNRLPAGTLGDKGENLEALIKATPDRVLSFSREYLVVVTKFGNGSVIHPVRNLGPGKAHLLNPTDHRLPVLRP